MQEPIKALMQSYSRTKAKNYKAFRETMELHTNSSNNTIFADAEGNIAYFHGNFIPNRDTRFDWTKPVDGSDPATDWKRLFSVDGQPAPVESSERLALQHQQLAVLGGRSEQPETGRLSRATWRTAARIARGLHAIRVLKDKKDFTIDSLIAAAYDSYLPPSPT